MEDGIEWLRQKYFPDPFPKELAIQILEAHLKAIAERADQFLYYSKGNFDDNTTN